MSRLVYITVEQHNHYSYIIDPESQDKKYINSTQSKTITRKKKQSLREYLLP